MVKNIPTYNLSVVCIAVLAIFLFGAVQVVFSPRADAAKCAGVDTALLGCTNKDGSQVKKKDGVMALLSIALGILSTGVGIVAVGGIAYGAFLYTSAGGSQDKVKKARDIIQNVIIGLIAFIGMYALISFLLPGASPF